MTDDNTSLSLPSPVAAIGVTLISVLVTFLIAGIATLFIQNVGLLLSEILFVIPLLFYVKHKEYTSEISRSHLFRLNPVSLKIILLSLMMGFAATLMGDLVDRMVQKVFPFPESLLEQLMQMMKINTLGQGIIIVLSVVIFAAVCEEIVFRGFLQSSLERAWGPLAAITASSFIFAFIHFNPWWFFQILLLGFFLGYLAWRSQSVYPGMVIHAVNNGIGVFAANMNDPTMETPVPDTQTLIWSFLVAGSIFFIAARFFHRIFDKTEVTEISEEIMS